MHVVEQDIVLFVVVGFVHFFHCSLEVYFPWPCFSPSTFRTC